MCALVPTRPPCCAPHLVAYARARQAGGGLGLAGLGGDGPYITDTLHQLGGGGAAPRITHTRTHQRSIVP
jgi:hypothetical protein